MLLRGCCSNHSLAVSVVVLSYFCKFFCERLVMGVRLFHTEAKAFPYT